MNLVVVQTPQPFPNSQARTHARSSPVDHPDHRLAHCTDPGPDCDGPGPLGRPGPGRCVLGLGPHALGHRTPSPTR
jgi:hypothetical protein